MQKATAGYIFCICKILEKKWEFIESVHQLFIDSRKPTIQLESTSCIIHCILIEFDIPMKLTRLIKICLNKKYSRVRVREHLSDNISY